ncbi:MAG: hypothetical protein LH645_00360 [Actinomycetia bacterium]|nr:hypothetical protein [Actinomycetes bacterium]
MTCTSMREDAATALLTGDALAAATADHLSRCVACRRDIDSLEGLPALLALLGWAADPTITLSPDAQLPIDRLLEAAARIQVRRRRRTVLAVAAAAAVLVVLPTALFLSRDPATPPTAATSEGTGTATPAVSVQRSASNQSTGVEGEVTLNATSVGSDLTFALRGVPPGTECTLVVVSADGSRESAARWLADYEGTAHVSGAVSTPLADIDHVDVKTRDGPVVLRVPVSSTSES